MGGAEKSKSSVPLQMLLYYNAYYSPCYVLLSLLIFIYKGERLRRPRPPPAALPRQPAHGAASRCAGSQLPYPDGTIGWEVAILAAYSIIESARIFEGAPQLPAAARDAAAALHHDCSRAPQG